MSFTWKGKAIFAKVQKAQVAALNEVMAECVTTAKGLVRVRTATLQGSVRFTPAVASGRGARGEWGSFDVNYAFWQEIGTYKMSAQPYLRPAADQHYPSLKARIKGKIG